jgi:predicted transposase YbfD/YdcC
MGVPMQKFARIFRGLPDPRAANALHELLDVLVIALAAVLCGAKCATDMALFGRSKEKLLRQFLRLEHGVPSHDTFSRVFRALEPEAFEQNFRRFMAAFAKANGIKLTGVVAVDGKALRGAYERGKSTTPLHMVNVFATEARMVLASRKAPGRNEAQGALEVLQMLSLEGCIVTTDALHCNRPFAAMVLKRGGHYALALKQNQRKLFEATVRRFARAGKRSVANSIEPSTHDRRETRRATIIRDTSVAAANRFPGTVALARITSRRRPHAGRADKPVVVRYYLLSKYMPASRVLQIVRSHWGIENRLHWVLDVVFNEDRGRARKDNGPENFAILRRFAINIVRAHPENTSMRQKVKRAGWDDAFLLDVLSHMR